MSRTNIFELLEKNSSISKDVERLDGLFDSTKCFEEDSTYHYGARSWTLKEYVDSYCFVGWKNRHRCLDVDDFLKSIDYDSILAKAKNNSLNDFLTIIEVIYNFWQLAAEHHDNGHSLLLSKRSNGAVTAQEIIDIMEDCLSEYNQKAFYFEEEERCIIAEDSPQVTAAAEASSPDIALEIVRYNHRQLSGDIAKKKVILKVLGDHLEGRRREISGINDSLYKTITGALNNLNIRHNNINPENKSSYHKAVAEMSVEDLEHRYDDLYQLILLAILEMDNKERQKEMKEFVQQISQ